MNKLTRPPFFCIALLAGLLSKASSQTNPISLTPTLGYITSGDVTSAQPDIGGAITSTSQGPSSMTQNKSGNIQWYVSASFAAPQNAMFSTNGSVSYGLEKTVTASASNVETGGSANGICSVDQLVAQASVGVGSQVAPGTSAGYLYTINGGDLVWTWFGSGYWSGVYTFQLSSLVANTSLVHPVSRYKDDAGVAGGKIIASQSGAPVTNSLSVTVQ